MPSQDFAAMREYLKEARRWGDLEEIARLEEELQAYRDYLDHCDECKWEAEQEDVRTEAYWEDRCE